MSEHNLMRRCILAATKAGARLFRNNTGMGWVGIVKARQGDTITLVDSRPFHAGLCTGSSDLIGWTPVIVTPDMVGRQLAIFTAIEVKAPTGKLRTEQEEFLSAINRTGGRGHVVRSLEELDTVMGRAHLGVVPS